MGLANPDRDKAIAGQRKQKEDFFNENIAKLSDEESKKFDALMQELFTKREIDPISHKEMAQELKWEMLPLFLNDKWIQTFIKRNPLMKLLLTIRDQISSTVKSKSATVPGVSDGK